jgi:hypothetical protein
MGNPMLRSGFLAAVGLVGLIGCKADDASSGDNGRYMGMAGMGAGGSIAGAGSGGQSVVGSGGTTAMHPTGSGGMGPAMTGTGSGGAHAGSGGMTGTMLTGTGGMTGAMMMAGTGGGTASGSGGMGAMAGTGGSTGSVDDADTAMLRDACVAEINMYRATLTDAPPLVRASAAQEMCSDMGAQVDGDAMVAHGFFRMKSTCVQTVGLGAQDTCPGWPVGSGGFGRYATVLDALKGCLQQMWAEGDPPEGRDACTADTSGCFQMHGHYLNMSNPKATAASCAFYKMKDGMSWWMNQDFVVKWF